MPSPKPLPDEMSEIERALRESFEAPKTKGFTSTTKELEESDYINELVLPIGARGKIPLTQDKFVKTENPALVQWERHTREFLGKLNKDFGHRVTAVMVFEWATGLKVKELAAAEGADPDNWRGGGHNGSANMHLRHINKILRDYFGKSYRTKIAGREVGNAYRVPKWFDVTRKMPCTLTLWPEFNAGTLEY